jgi:hypothetical protein
LTLHRLQASQLSAERRHYECLINTPQTDPNQRRVAQVRLREIAAEEARRRSSLDKGEQSYKNRWPNVPLAELIQEAGCTLHDRGNGTLVGDHDAKHSSKSGNCLVVWPAEGRYYCSSCKESGDAPAWLSSVEGITYREACRRLVSQYGLPPGMPNQHREVVVNVY